MTQVTQRTIGGYWFPEWECDGASFPSSFDACFYQHLMENASKQSRVNAFNFATKNKQEAQHGKR